MNLLFWIRVNEYFTSQRYYRKNTENTKFVKLYIRLAHLQLLN